MQSQRKYIAAICATPTVLQKSGVLNDRSMAFYPSVQSQFRSYTDERVVVNGNPTTSQSPGIAMEFALKLLEILFGINAVNAGILARI
jgi:protein deglycase